MIDGPADHGLPGLSICLESNRQGSLPRCRWQEVVDDHLNPKKSQKLRGRGAWGGANWFRNALSRALGCGRLGPARPAVPGGAGITLRLESFLRMSSDAPA